MQTNYPYFLCRVNRSFRAKDVILCNPESSCSWRQAAVVGSFRENESSHKNRHALRPRVCLTGLSRSLKGNCMWCLDTVLVSAYLQLSIFSEPDAVCMPSITQWISFTYLCCLTGIHFKFFHLWHPLARRSHRAPATIW